MVRFFSLMLMVLAIGILATANGQQKKAPNFVLKSADGTSYELDKMKGKVVVVNFWATWCGPCRKEIPDFIEAYKKYQDKGLEIIGIALDQDGWAKVTPFVKQNSINYPIVLGDETITDAYGGINAIPTTFVVDKKGNIVSTTVGMMNFKQLEAKLKGLL